MAKHYEWGDYYIPGTHVLRNLFTSPEKPYGETDPVKLRELEDGSPPHTRGTLHRRLQRLTGLRPIPAHTGNTCNRY